MPARVTAASYIIDQYIGKATQPTREDPPAKDLGPLESLSLEQLEVLKRLMTRYTPEQIDRLMGLEKKQADSVGSEVERVQRGPGGMEAKRRG
ncbi:MAG: hypothetical protein A2X50_06000 [Candidatus Rokubacteria bacterium GWF2_70_14]|nr:MAG: hypothetical protein A2X50_06000 [Candidatus Rokubacteria bacterium GWF2_70_14]